MTIGNITIKKSQRNRYERQLSMASQLRCGFKYRIKRWNTASCILRTGGGLISTLDIKDNRHMAAYMILKVKPSANKKEDCDMNIAATGA